MKQLLLLVGLTLLSTSPSQATNAAACYTIGNPDARAHCLAKAHADPGRRYSIQAADRRAQCLAEVRR